MDTRGRRQTPMGRTGRSQIHTLLDLLESATSPTCFKINIGSILYFCFLLITKFTSKFVPLVEMIDSKMKTVRMRPPHSDFPLLQETELPVQEA